MKFNYKLNQFHVNSLDESIKSKNFLKELKRRKKKEFLEVNKFIVYNVLCEFSIKFIGKKEKIYKKDYYTRLIYDDVENLSICIMEQIIKMKDEHNKIFQIFLKIIFYFSDFIKDTHKIKSEKFKNEELTNEDGECYICLNNSKLLKCNFSNDKHTMGCLECVDKMGTMICSYCGSDNSIRKNDTNEKQFFFFID